MKKIIRLVFVLSLLSLLSGCAYYSKMAVPGEPAQQGKYEILKHIKKSVTGTRFLTIPVNIPSSAQIIKDEVAAVGGDGVINLEVTFSEFNFFLLSFPIVEVEADVVKIAGKVTDIHRSEEGLISKQLEIKSQIPDSDQNAFEEWKREILKYGDLQLKMKWKSFVKRNSISVSWEEWVKSLSRSEYEDYLQSKLKVRKWLGNRLDQ